MQAVIVAFIGIAVMMLGVAVTIPTIRNENMTRFYMGTGLIVIGFALCIASAVIDARNDDAEDAFQERSTAATEGEILR